LGNISGGLSCHEKTIYHRWVCDVLRVLPGGINTDGTAGFPGVATISPA